MQMKDRLLALVLVSLLAPACASSPPCEQAAGEIRKAVREAEGDDALGREIMKGIDACLAGSNACAIATIAAKSGSASPEVITAHSADTLPKQLPPKEQLAYMLLPVKTGNATGCVFAQSSGRADPWFARGWLWTSGKASQFVLRDGYDVEYAKQFPHKKENAVAAEMGPSAVATVLLNQFAYCEYRQDHAKYACKRPESR
jgi:hypothetical protein